MSDEYKAKMARAQQCEDLIARVQGPGGSTREPLALNFAARAQRDWHEAVGAYQEALEIYGELNQQDKAAKLLDSLFDLVQTCDHFTSTLAIQLLCTLNQSHRWLEQVAAGTKDRLKASLSVAIAHKLREKEMDFWLLLGAVDLLRDLADDDTERRTADTCACQLMEMGAILSFRRGNLDNAQEWYSDAARIAQDRLGNAQWANRLLEVSSYVRKIRATRPVSPAFVQAMKSEAPSSPGYVEAMRQLSIAESLEVIVHKTVQKRRGEPFLPPLEELVREYESEEVKLIRLLDDERFLLDESMICSRAARYRGQGLLGWLGGRFVDSRWNPRGNVDIEHRFTVQYVEEVAKAIGELFNTWQEKGHLQQSHITGLLERTAPYFAWSVYEAGLARHFDSDLICAVHTLVPQFENVVRTATHVAGIDIKKLKGGVPGDILLNDLVNPTNAEVRGLLGPGLFDLIYWYFVNSGGPFGYRHKVAHGWIRAEDCTFELSAMTIWLTLKVVNRIGGLKTS